MFFVFRALVFLAKNLELYASSNFTSYIFFVFYINFSCALLCIETLKTGTKFYGTGTIFFSTFKNPSSL